MEKWQYNGENNIRYSQRTSRLEYEYDLHAIKRCIAKGAIERIEPNFMCHALIKKEQVQEQETSELINKVFDGSTDLLFASLLNRRNLSCDEIERLKQIVNNLK